MRIVYFVFVIAACFHAALSRIDDPDEEYQDHNVKERPVGRSYSLTTCDYKNQIGYSCITCNRALHCYVGNVAILVDCYGLFRFCRDGRCSRFQGEKCVDSKLTTLSPFNNTIQDTTNVATSSEGTTKLMTDVSDIQSDEKAITKSDNSLTVTESDVKVTTKSDANTILDISGNVV